MKVSEANYFSFSFFKKIKIKRRFFRSVVKAYFNKMESTDDYIAVVGLVLALKKKRSKNRRKPRVWCKDWLLKRNQYSHVNLL